MLLFWIPTDFMTHVSSRLISLSIHSYLSFLIVRFYFDYIISMSLDFKMIPGFPGLVVLFSNMLLISNLLFLFTTLR